MTINQVTTPCEFQNALLFRGRISYFTHPPETHTLPTHVSAEIVSEMGKAFDWDELEKGNEKVLAGKSYLVWNLENVVTVFRPNFRPLCRWAFLFGN